MSALASYLVISSAQRTSGTYGDFEVPLSHTALKAVTAVELVSVQIPLIGPEPEDSGSEGEGEPEPVPSPLADDLYAFIRIREFSPLQMVEGRSGRHATFYVPVSTTEGTLSYEPQTPQRALFDPPEDISVMRVQLVRFGDTEAVELGADWAFVLKIYHKI